SHRLLFLRTTHRATGCCSSALRIEPPAVVPPYYILLLFRRCSYAYEQDDGLYLECQFVFDLELPESFQPTVGDGEVQEFYLWPLDKVRSAIATEEFKPNCALVVLDFLMRKGHIQPDTEKFYTKFMENLHGPL
ncbi:uncharacterized protein LOC142134085, partial [Mixophyes fleayi]|uniref:uncharacterized protein LOC142134085 n=1 Tax=Mixophyes fleayi TaxID=3061075 RepID=UPI003F4D8792